MEIKNLGLEELSTQEQRAVAGGSLTGVLVVAALLLLGAINAY